MNWQRKALIQRVCARLPFGSEQIYYRIQRSFGSLRQAPHPRLYLDVCLKLATSLQKAGIAVEGARVMEVGTGHGIQNPIGFFLCGAASVVSFDLHRYLRAELVKETLAILVKDKDRVVRSLGSVADAATVEKRLALLAQCETIDDILRTTNIDYRAPADATNTGLPDHSIDIQFSDNVFEHIPYGVLKEILLEGNRILTPNGVALHGIDPSDHFAEDKSILPINFLRYEQEEWDRLADNQFAYHNRLRASDFKKLYAASGHHIVEWSPISHPESLRALEAGFPLAAQFQNKSAEDLSTIHLQVVSCPLTAERARRQVDENPAVISSLQ
jgi:hypothetical protein